MTPTGFDSWRSFWAVASAREFFDIHAGKAAITPSSRFERVGDHLSSLLIKPLDVVMREFRNPLVIVALTVSLVFIASIIFYPAYTLGVVCRVLPFLKAVRPHHVKCALYILTQTVIAGIGIRTVGRLSNDELMAAVRNGRLAPIPIGAVRI